MGYDIYQVKKLIPMKRNSSLVTDFQRAGAWCDSSMRCLMNGSWRCESKGFSRLHREPHVTADRESCVPEKRCTRLLVYKLGGNADTLRPML